MYSDLKDAQVGLGTAKGGVYATQEFGVERQAERASARAVKEQKQQELDKLKATRPTAKDLKTEAEIASLELDRQREELVQVQRQNNERATYEGMRRHYTDPSDARHLNQMFGDLKRNGSQQFANVNRVDLVTEQDRDMFIKAGFSEQQTNAVYADPDLLASYIKTTQTDGTQGLDNLDNIKQTMRYNQYATSEELAVQKDNIMKQQLIAFGYEATPTGMEAFRRARATMPDEDPKSPKFQEELTKQMDVLRSSGIRGENQTQREAEAARITATQGVGPGDPGYNEAYQQNYSALVDRDRQTSTGKNIDASEATRTILDEKAGGNFASADLSDPKERGKYARDIARLKKEVGYKPSESSKKVLRQMRSVVNLGSTASEITEDQTGIFDSLLHSAKKYITNNVSGTRQTSALAWMNNVARNTLFGATVPAAEFRAFTDAAGSQKQQLAPLLEAMSVNLGQIRDELQYMMDTEDPDIMLWELGMTEDQVSGTLDAIDDTVAKLQGEYERVATPTSKKTIEIGPGEIDQSLVPSRTVIKPGDAAYRTPEDNAKLDAIYMGGAQ